jgi:hypothetical protein
VRKVKETSANDNILEKEYINLGKVKNNGREKKKKKKTRVHGRKAGGWNWDKRT